MQAFINRFRYQATKAAQVQSRIKMLDKIVPIEIPPERKRVHFTFPACAEERPDGAGAEGRPQGVRTTAACSTASTCTSSAATASRSIGPNGAGKSTLMRMLSGVEAPDTGTRAEGHQVVMQYFAQDEATRLDPTLTVYQTLAGDSPIHMVPNIRNILGGFLFSGDDIDKPVRVLSGGERTRLAVARMLLRPANTLLLDEPTNHLDLDSKDVLLEALEDFGGTLIFVSHDRYFVDKLATKIIEIGHGERAWSIPGTYEEFLWSRKQRATAAVRHRASRRAPAPDRVEAPPSARPPPRPTAAASAPKPQQARRKPQALLRREGSGRTPRPGASAKDADAQARRIEELEARIAERERGDQGARGPDVRAGFLRQPRGRQADHRPASGPDVGGRAT